MADDAEAVTQIAKYLKAALAQITVDRAATRLRAQDSAAGDNLPISEVMGSDLIDTATKRWAEDIVRLGARVSI